MLEEAEKARDEASQAAMTSIQEASMKILGLIQRIIAEAANGTRKGNKYTLILIHGHCEGVSFKKRESVVARWYGKLNISDYQTQCHFELIKSHGNNL